MKPPYFDTSALAKWYLPEPYSKEVETLLEEIDGASISRLTVVEFRCLHARKLRAGQIDAAVAEINQKLFESHIRQGILRVEPVTDVAFALADDLLARLTDIPLRTLDALHLAIASNSGCTKLATADKIMADAAQALGLTTHSFFDPRPTS